MPPMNRIANVIARQDFILWWKFWN